MVISSRSGYVELKPVSKEDKDIKEHIKAVSFLAVSSRIKKEEEEGRLLRFDTVQELRDHLAAL